MTHKGNNGLNHLKHKTMDAPVKTYTDSILCQVNLLFGNRKLPAYKPVLNMEEKDRHSDQASY